MLRRRGGSLRNRPGVLFLLPVLAAGISACAGSADVSHPALETFWEDYSQLPGRRALAVAGDPDSPRWVAGAAGGLASAAEARQRALEECRARRQERRMQAPCWLYAVDDEVVWPGP